MSRNGKRTSRPTGLYLSFFGGTSSGEVPDEQYTRLFSTAAKIATLHFACQGNAKTNPLCASGRFFMIKHGSRIFSEGGIIGKKQEWNYDEELFQRWRDGKTGVPLVDANMRELKETGAL